MKECRMHEQCECCGLRSDGAADGSSAFLPLKSKSQSRVATHHSSLIQTMKHGNESRPIQSLRKPPHGFPRERGLVSEGLS